MRNNWLSLTNTRAGLHTFPKDTRPWVSKWTPKEVLNTANGLLKLQRPDSLGNLVCQITLHLPLQALSHVDNWSHTANPMKKSPFGVWECYVPPSSPGVCAIPHDSMVKISMTTSSGASIDRLPAWIQRVTQDLNISPIYDARFWNPPKEQTYQFKHGHSTQSIEGLKIYEAHGEFFTLPDR